MKRFEIERAVQRAPLPAPSKALMMVLCSRISARTREIEAAHSPSLQSLARMTGLSKSTVCAHLAGLEAGGWVRRARRPAAEAGKFHLTTVYELCIPAVFISPDPCPVPGPGAVRVPDTPGPRSGHDPVRQPDPPGPGAGHKQKETESRTEIVIDDDSLAAIARDEVLALTGKTLTGRQAAETVRLVLAGRPVGNPAGYLREAIRREPQRFAPRGIWPPPFRDLARLQREAIERTERREHDRPDQ